MYRGILMFSVLAFAGSASAQQVYKCVEPGKPISYQSQACPGQAVKAWDAVPDQDNPYLRARLAQMEREVAQRRAAQRPAVASVGGYGASRATGASIRITSDACESARRQRAVVYNAAGLRRSFSTSSTMDNIVHNACK